METVHVELEFVWIKLHGLNCIFHWYAHFSINLRSEFKISAVII